MELISTNLNVCATHLGDSFEAYFRLSLLPLGFCAKF